MPRLGTGEALEAAFAAVLAPSDLCVRLLERAASEYVRSQDLAAVFTLLRAVAGCDQALVSEALFAKIARALVFAERAVGGPYLTLPVDAETATCDLEVNAAIANFLAQFGQELPNLQQFLNGYQQPADESSQEVAELFAAQLPDGWWPDENGRPDLVATARAVTLLVGQPKGRAAQETPRRTQTDGHVLARDVFKLARQQIEQLGTPARTAALHMLDRVRQADRNHEIALIGYMFARSLRGKPCLPRDLFVRLGVANVYNWMAYTIYDDFLDDEGDPALLSIANISMRAAVRGFRSVSPAATYRRFVDSAFDAVDNANAWELAACRFPVAHERITIQVMPRYGKLEKLAERSLTHSLPALAVLAAQGFLPESPVAMAAQTAFKQYLVARQLNDDLRDWEADLRSGHISYIVHLLLRELRCKPGVRDVRKLLPRLRERFWQTLDARCDEVMQHTAATRAALEQTHVVVPGGIDKLCDDIDKSLRRTQADYAKALNFAAAYKAPAHS